jgi:hypothetical protein
LFIYTKHAIQKMDALGIDKKDIELSIRKGMKWKEEGSNKIHSQMAGIEVVFIKRNKDFFIITAYLARRSK